MEERGAEQDKWVRDFPPPHPSRSQLCAAQDCLARQKPVKPVPASKEIPPVFWCQHPAPVPRFKTSGRELLQKEKATANDF